jgi:hypothetical protein
MERTCSSTLQLQDPLLSSQIHLWIHWSIMSSMCFHVETSLFRWFSGGGNKPRCELYFATVAVVCTFSVFQPGWPSEVIEVSVGPSNWDPEISNSWVTTMRDGLVRFTVVSLNWSVSKVWIVGWCHPVFVSRCFGLWWSIMAVPIDQPLGGTASTIPLWCAPT